MALVRLTSSTRAVRSRVLTDHRLSRGTGMPLVEKVVETMPTLTPWTVRTSGRLRSVEVRAVPVCPSLLESRTSSVRLMPRWPSSSEWLEAVVHAS